MSHNSRNNFDHLREGVLEVIYELPRLPDERFFHGDLGSMSAHQLRREFERCHLRLLLDPSPEPWLLDRFDVLAARVERHAF